MVPHGAAKIFFRSSFTTAVIFALHVVVGREETILDSDVFLCGGYKSQYIPSSLFWNTSKLNSNITAAYALIAPLKLWR